MPILTIPTDTISTTISTHLITHNMTNTTPTIADTTYMGEPAEVPRYVVQQHIYSDKYRISNTSRSDYPHKGRLSVDEC